MYFFIFILFRRANSEDPNQTPHSEASDLGLHCLPMSQKWGARLIWVNIPYVCLLSNKNLFTSSGRKTGRIVSYFHFLVHVIAPVSEYDCH